MAHCGQTCHRKKSNARAPCIRRANHVSSYCHSSLTKPNHCLAFCLFDVLYRYGTLERPMQKVRSHTLFSSHLTRHTEKSLQNLMKQRRAKVEDIKRRTNFDSMVKLFQEYDELPPGTKPLRERVMSKQNPVTPRRQGTALGRSPMPPTLRAQLTRMLS